MATHSSILAWESRDRSAGLGAVHGVTKSQAQMSEICLVFSSQRRSRWTPGRGRTCPESPCVCQSRSQDPGVLSPGQLSVQGPTWLLTSMTAVSSRLGFCPVHPRSAQTCPISPRRVLAAAESGSSSARWGGSCQRPLVPPSPLFLGPLDLPVLETQTWTWKPAPLPLSTLSVCSLLAAGSCLFITSLLITQTLLPHDLCLVGNTFLIT